MNRRMTIYVVVLYALLALAAGWSVRHLFAERAAARTAAAALAECRGYEKRILRLRGRPAMAAEQERASAEVSAPIEEAAKAAGVPADRLVRISPEPARRLGESPYKEKPTRVFLKNVSMQEIVTVAHRLVGEKHGFDLKSVRLDAADRGEATGRWSAELVFVYLIYDPARSRL